MAFVFYTYYIVQTYRFYIFLISFLVGIGVATIFNIPLAAITWLCLIALGFMVLGSRRSEASSTPALVTTSIAIIFCAVGMLRFEVATWQFGHSALEQYVGQEISLQGQVVKEPDVREEIFHLYVQTSDDVVLVTADSYSEVSYGDEVTIKGKLKTPEEFTTELGRTFNYPAYLLVRGVEYQISFAQVEVISEDQGFVVLEVLFSIKQTFLNSIESVLQEPYAGLGEGLLLGVKQGLGEDLEAVFRTSGIIHIVVLSGYNVMLVVTFILFLLSFFLARRSRITVGLVAVIVFALLVGLSATVVRASIMASLLLVADFLGRRYDLKRALLFAATAMVFFNPYLLMYDVGFQLSFMATLGLILVAPTFESFISDGFAKLSLKDFFVSTIATQVAVLPLLVYHIGEVSLVAVVVNVLVLPVVPLAMLLTFFSGLAAIAFTPLALPISFLAYMTLRYIIEVATFFASLPLASFTVPPVGPWIVFVMYGGLAALLYFFSYKSKDKSEVKGWVIEEEPERAGVALRTTPAPAETPVFFR